MKKVLLSLVLTISTMFSSVWAWTNEVDFTATAPSGQTLYFYITTHTSQYSSVSVAGWDVYFGDSISIIGNLVIPSSVTYNGMIYSVTTIYEGAFQGGRDLTSITIPNSITSIEHAAFAGCTGLTSITIPNSVTSIGDYAFNGCTGLTSITIPNSITSIEHAAFAGCTGLTSITIPNSVTSIGGWAFDGVINIVYHGTATSDNNWGARYRNKYYENGFVYEDSTKTILLKYVGTDTNVTIPNSVTTIGGSAFAGCSGLTSVTIPNSVDTIGYYAFSNTGLTSITIPENVKYVGGTAFGNYGSEIPSSLTTVVWNAKDATIETNNYGNAYSPFYGCSNISTVTFGDSVRVIPHYLFRNCTGLTSVTIGNSVTTIGGSAFAGCTGLTSVTLPNSVDTIGREAFYNTGLTSITIPENVRYIGSNAFGIDVYGNQSSSLTTVVWNAKNATIESSPFSGCNNISTITFGDSVQMIPNYLFLSISENITPNVYYGRDIESWINIERPIGNTAGFSDYYGMFSGRQYNLYINNQLVTNLDIPNTVDTIQSGTFNGCSSIQSVTIPTQIKFIGKYAFFGCNNLSSVTWNAINCDLEWQIFGDYYAFNTTSLVLGDSVQVIPDDAFVALGITNVNLPASLTTIGASAFLGCVNLASITIPSQVTTIGNYAFAECGNLRSITMEPTVPPTIYSQTFDEVGTGVRVNVPCGTVEDYSSAAFWFNFSNIQQSNECVRTITAMSLNTSQGTVLGGGTYEYGSTATIAAIPKTGYQFYQWNDGDITNPRSLVVSSDSSFIATFSSITTGGGLVHDTLYVDRYIYDTIYTTIHDTVTNNIYDTIIVTNYDTVVNTVYDTIINTVHDTVINTVHDTIINTVHDTVINTVHDTIINTVHDTITITQYDTIINTVYDTIVNTVYDTITVSETYYTLDVTSTNSAQGIGAGSGSYPEGCVVTIVGLPMEGYRFVSWNDGNTDNPRQITISENASYVANFSTVDIEEAPEVQNLSVYPNPTNGVVTISEYDVNKVEIYDGVGKKVREYISQRVLDMSDLSSGEYMLRITLPQGVAVRKVIKR